MKNKVVSLAHGWENWTFGPFGKAKSWRLFSPDGQCFIPEEVLSLTPLLLDLDFYQTEVKKLQALLTQAKARPEKQVLTQISLLLVQMMGLPEIESCLGDTVIRGFRPPRGLGSHRNVYQFPPRQIP